MLSINLDDIVWFDEEVLGSHLRQHIDDLQIAITVPDLYQAQSIIEIAENWLKVWYIVETIASCASSANCTFREGSNGDGEFLLTLAGIDPGKMQAKLLEFGAAFDPDDLEAAALIYDEAADWLEKRGDAIARFPEIEECYRDDAASAEDWRAENPDDE